MNTTNNSRGGALIDRAILRQYALYYIGLGIPVLPLAQGTTKMLGGLTWSNPENLIRTAADVDRYWPLPGDAGPGLRYNIAIVCGPVSGVLGIDFDSKNELWGTAGGTFEGTGPALLDIVVGPDTKHYPKTWAQRTKSGGYHALYKWDYEKHPVGSSASVLAPGVDIRAIGGILYAAPSQTYATTEKGYPIAPGRPGHAIVGQYAICADLDKMTISEPVPSLVDAIVDTIKKDTTRKTRGLARVVESHKSTTTGEGDINKRAAGFVRDYATRASAGNRNKTGLDLACQLRDLGLSFDDALQHMYEYQKSVPQTSADKYTIAEAENTLESAYKTDRRDPPPTNIKTQSPALKIGPLRADNDTADETPGETATAPQKPAKRASRDSMPALPPDAVIDDHIGVDGCPWLDEYTAYSAHWSNRAWSSFHTAVGIWMLSTVAARRVMVITGAGETQHTGLYALLTAPSSTFAKTTTARVGYSVLKDAGLQHLLLPDELTPQALIRSMSQTYAETDVDATYKNVGGLSQAVAFASQRGWMYEEFGSKLQAMSTPGSVHSEYHRLLREFYDTTDVFSSMTLTRGSETIHNPYLALLGMLTPADMTRHAGKNNALWSDGFWARFLFACPPLYAVPVITKPSREQRDIPHSLTAPLRDWHTRLGIPQPQIEYETVVDNKRKSGRPPAVKGTDQADQVRTKQIAIITKNSDDHPTNIMRLSPEAQDMYENYSLALQHLALTVDDDLRGFYSRLHDKALRIAALFASLSGEGQSTHGGQTGAVGIIGPHHWAKAQAIAELFRGDFHAIYTTTSEGIMMSRARTIEDKIMRVISTYPTGAKTRDLYRRLHMSSDEIGLTLRKMIDSGLIVSDGEGEELRFLSAE